VAEIHDTHHPVATALYYEDQKPEAKRKAAGMRQERLPKYLGYFERVLKSNPAGDRYVIGRRLTYVDLSLFQVVAGLRYMFPRAMAKLEGDIPRVVAVHDKVLRRPRIEAYLASKRRIPFNTEGIFRHYPELDG
jgi:glutathione S-transferase